MPLAFFLTIGIFKIYQSTENRLENAHTSLLPQLSSFALFSSITPFLAQSENHFINKNTGLQKMAEYKYVNTFTDDLV